MLLQININKKYLDHINASLFTLVIPFLKDRQTLFWLDYTFWLDTFSYNIITAKPARLLSTGPFQKNSLDTKEPALCTMVCLPPSYLFPSTTSPFFSISPHAPLSLHFPPALPLTIKKYLCNFKWHLSAGAEKKQQPEKSSEGVYPHPALFPSLLLSNFEKCVIDFFFSPNHVFHFLRVISWCTFWQPNQIFLPLSRSFTRWV